VRCTRRLHVSAGARVLVDGRRADVLAGKARFTVTDRCNGTRVSAQRGRVRIVGGPTLRAPAARLVR